MPIIFFTYARCTLELAEKVTFSDVGWVNGMPISTHNENQTVSTRDLAKLLEVESGVELSEDMSVSSRLPPFPGDGKL